MYSCPFCLRYRQTPLKERVLGTYLTPVGMLYPQARRLRTLHTHQAKAKMLRPPS